jgi:hypothetical protein
MTSLIPVVGLLCTTLVLLLWYPKQIKTGRLAALYTVDSARTLSSLDQKSLYYKLLASGLNIRPVTFRLLSLSAGICGIAIAWLFLPGLPAIVIGAILIYIPGAWLEDRVKSRGRVIDQLLPIAIGRTAAGFLAGGSVPDVLQQVGESLEMEKSNPLTPEFVLTASEMRIKDRLEALRSLASRSPSVLGNCLSRIQTGFDQFFEVVFGKSLDDMFGKLGWGDFFGRVGHIEFFMQPTVKGPQSNIHISQRFGREGICIPAPALGFVLGTHPGQVGDEIRGRDHGDILISDMLLPLVQIVFIGVNRTLA